MTGTKGKLPEDRDAQSISLIRISCPRFAVAAFSTSIGKDRKGDEGSIRDTQEKESLYPFLSHCDINFRFRVRERGGRHR